MSIRSRFASLFSASTTPSAPRSQNAKPNLESDGPKLNLGCGWDLREGWVNVDLHSWHNPDIVADVTRLEPIIDNFAGYALAQDILEHIHRERCMTALQEWNRVLRMTGILSIRTTDVIGIVQLMQSPDRQSPAEHARLLRCMFGTQSYEGDFHLNGFTELWLRDALEKAGFEVVYFGRQDQWLVDVLARKIHHRPPDPLLAVAENDGFLDEAYKRHLNREPDDEGRAFFLEQLSKGTPREVVLATLRDAKE